MVVTTPGAAEILRMDELAPLLARHASGDWGIVPDDDWQENDLSVEHGWRVLSSYVVRDSRIWVLTEADRMTTTVLLPSEY